MECFEIENKTSLGNTWLLIMWPGFQTEDFGEERGPQAAAGREASRRGACMRLPLRPRMPYTDHLSYLEPRSVAASTNWNTAKATKDLGKEKREVPKWINTILIYLLPPATLRGRNCHGYLMTKKLRHREIQNLSQVTQLLSHEPVIRAVKAVEEEDSILLSIALF